MTPRVPTHTFSPSLPPWSAALLAGAGILAGALPASAQASLDNAAGRPVLSEARFVHDVEFAGSFAVIESTQVVSNPTSRSQEAVYTFDLPVAAAVTGVTIRLGDGRTTTSAVVDSVAALHSVPDPEGLDAAPDVGLLRLVARDKPDIIGPSPLALATYELRMSPIASRRTATAVVKWVAPLHHDDGRLSLRIPQRGDEANLVRERVLVTLRPPPGARGFSSVHGGGRGLGKNARNVKFTAPLRGDILIEATLDHGARRNAPIVSFGTVPLRGKMGAFGVSILAPRAVGRSQLGQYERVLLIADTSISMETEGVRAIADLADGLLASIKSGTRVELITFDRKARRAFGTFVKNGAQARKRVARALNKEVLENGSDLGAALELARQTLRRTGSRRALDQEVDTLIVLFTDGMVPLNLDGQAAIERIGSDTLERAQMFPVVLVPDRAPMPDVGTGTMAELAYATSEGRALGLRVADAAVQAKNLSAELNRPAPLTDLRLESKKGLIKDISMPFSLVPGQGLIAIGSYAGGAPGAVTLHARQRNRDLVFVGKRDGNFKRVGGPLGLLQMVPVDFIAVDARQPDNGADSYDATTMANARRRLIAAAGKYSTVTEHSSLVALARKDGFARDRLAMLKKWGAGAYMRLPPPAERESDHALRSFEERVGDERLGGRQRRRTGELDRDIIKRLLSNHVLPKARGCYETALRRHAGLQGALIVVVEVVRGEVQYATVERSTFGKSKIPACVAAAAYSMQVPRVALGDDPETVGVVRYPLTFKPSKRGGAVEAGAYREPEIDPLLLDTDPLGGLPAGGGEDAD